MELFAHAPPVFEAGVGARIKVGESTTAWAAASGSLCHKTAVHLFGQWPDVMVLSPGESRCCKLCLRIAASRDLRILALSDAELSR